MRSSPASRSHPSHEPVDAVEPRTARCPPPGAGLVILGGGVGVPTSPRSRRAESGVGLVSVIWTAKDHASGSRVIADSPARRIVANGVMPSRGEIAVLRSRRTDGGSDRTRITWRLRTEAQARGGRQTAGATRHRCRRPITTQAAKLAQGGSPATARALQGRAARPQAARWESSGGRFAHRRSPITAAAASSPTDRVVRDERSATRRRETRRESHSSSRRARRRLRVEPNPARMTPLGARCLRRTEAAVKGAVVEARVRPPSGPTLAVHGEVAAGQAANRGFARTAARVAGGPPSWAGTCWRGGQCAPPRRQA